MAEGETPYQGLVSFPVGAGGSRRNNAQKAEERRICYELRLLGYSVGKVAELASGELGWTVSKSTAWRRIEEEGLQRVQPAEDALRAQELDRLDSYLLRLERIIFESQDPKDKLAAINTALKLQERRAKLTGLDAPQKADVTVHEVSEADVELAAMVREAKAAQARLEAELAEEVGS